MTNPVRVVVLVAVGVLVALGVWLLSGDDVDAPGRPDSVTVDDAAHFDHEYLIPLGTGDRIRDGAVVEILPRELVVRVGESIRIVNDDDEGHVVGVFYVGAGETLTQRFDSPGELTGECDVHPSGEFTLRVVA